MNKFVKISILFSSLLCVLSSCNLNETPSFNSESINASFYTVHKVTIDGILHNVIDGEKAPLLTPKDNENQIFVCWMSEGEVFDPSTPIYKDTIITSSWRDRLTFSVYFEEEKVDVKEGYKVEKPVDPYREGYVFDGWYDEAKKFDFNTLITKDYHLKARFIIEGEEDSIDYTSLNYVDLGSIGGTNARKYNLGLYRDLNNIVFKYSTEETTLKGEHGVGFYLQVGEKEYTGRNSNSFLISTFESGEIVLYNYPDTVKKTIGYKSQYSNIWGFKTETILTSSSIDVYVLMPISFFKNYVDNDVFDEYSPIGITFTSDDSKTGKYDVYTKEEYFGFNNKIDVNRNDPRDYLRYSYFNTIYDYNNNEFDTFINLKTNAKNSKIRYLNNEINTNSSGDANIKIKRNGLESIDLIFDDLSFKDNVKNINLENKNFYNLSFELNPRKENITFVIMSLDGKTPIGDAKVTYKDEEYISNINGEVIIPSINLNEDISLIIEKDGYVKAYKSYVSAKEIFLLRNEIRLASYLDNTLIKGVVKDHNDNLIANAKVTFSGLEPVYTNDDGYYEIVSTFERRSVNIIAAGYLDLDIEIDPISKQNEDFTFNFELTTQYVSFGSVGGTNAPKWDIEATRNSKNLLFKFTSNETITNTTLSIGPSVFFALGNIRNTGNRNERNIVISCYNSTTDYAAYYPDGTKTNIDENNLVKRTKQDNIFYLSISYDIFDITGLNVNSQDDIGFSFTSDNSTKWDVYYYESILGHNNNSEVNREKSLDYLVWTKTNEIKEYTNYVMDEKTLNDLFRTHPNHINGKDFTTNRATIETTNGTVEQITDNAHLFTDRLTQKYDWDIDTAPIVLFNGTFKYTYCPISSGSKWKVTKSGYVMLLIPNTGSYATLKSKVKEEWGEYVLYSWNKCNSLTDNLNYLIKWCEVGETYEYGKFNVAIF